MTEQLVPPTIAERINLFDTTYFIGIPRTEAQEIIEEAPHIAWRLNGLLQQHVQ